RRPSPRWAPTIQHRAAIAPRPTGSAKLVSDDLPVFHWRHDARITQSRATGSNDHRDSAVFGISILSGGGSVTQKPSSRKRKSISRTVSDLTGMIQSAGVE